MPTKSNNGKGVAFAKRAKIDSAQKNMLIAVCATSVLLGVTAVGSIYMFKKIGFNNAKKNENSAVIKNYKETQNNLQKLSVAVGELANNENLEVVSQKRSSFCNNNIATSEDGMYSIEDISLARTCSSLRVISDALPVYNNQDASNSSINYLLIYKNDEINIEGISSADSVSSSRGALVDESGNPIQLNTLYTSIGINDTASKVKTAMNSIENSIRNFDLTSISFSWSEDLDNSSNIKMNAMYSSYYANPVQILKKKKVICADNNSEACIKKKGNSSL